MKCPWCGGETEERFLEGFMVCPKCKLGFDVNQDGEIKGSIWSCLKDFEANNPIGEWTEVTNGVLMVKEEYAV